jgi:pantoate--beta-alanine ligase
VKVLETIQEVGRQTCRTRLRGNHLGFVPTMGALHEGHLALISRSIAENRCTAVSIFVNPIQFNNPTDLEKYPRDLETDLNLLGDLLREDDFVFVPSVREMYPEPVTTRYDFGALESVMEGRYRPGHFNGVGIVVNRLLRIVEPDRLYLGEKDFQQLAVIRKLTQIEQLPVEIVPCPIVREPDGLAMSSRNQRLTPEHRRVAPAIFQALKEASADFSTRTIAGLKRQITEQIEATGLLKAEYVEFADETTLQPLEQKADSKAIRCFVAVQAGEVRLIDNVGMG